MYQTAAKSCKRSSNMYTSPGSGKRSDVYTFVVKIPVKHCIHLTSNTGKTIRINAKREKSNIVNPLLSQVHEPSETLHG